MPQPIHSVALVPRSADKDDVYKDIVRIPRSYRGDLRYGFVHKFRVGRESSYFILRGAADKHDNVIMLDAESRKKLRLPSKVSDPVNFEITEANFWGELMWAWKATDPAYRVAAKLGVLSFFLGILSFALALLSLL